MARLVLAIAFASAASPSLAATFNLSAKTTTVTMPDGRTVPMWTFACDSAVAPAACPAAGTSVPGPTLAVPAGDGTLVINLTNTLPVPTSIVIPGQTAQMAPVWFVDPSGRSRVRSFTHETGPGQTGQYVWNGLKSGTYLYQSGTHPQVQVQMGLYGAMTKAAGVNLAYSGVPYDLERVLLFSEIDPALHDAVSIGEYGTPAYPSTINYAPKYFLINGAPFTPPPATSCLPGVANPGSRVLFRMLNAGLRELAPMLLEEHWSVVAEGGSPYRVTAGATSAPNPKRQYSVLLAPGGTTDVVFQPAAAGTYRLIERRLNLTNWNDPDGGFQTCLVTAPSAAPPVASVSPAALAFPATLLGTISPPLTVTVSNGATGGPLSITSIAFTGTNPTDFVVDGGGTCAVGEAVAPGGSCTILARFSPKGNGPRTATLAIGTNDPAHATLLVSPVEGTALAPVATVTPTSVDFGVQQVGVTSAPRTVTLKNDGGAPLTIVDSNVSPAGNFTQTNDCPATLAPGASCSFAVRFAPPQNGTFSAALVIDTDAANLDNGRAVVALSGTGSTVPPPATGVTLAAQPASPTSPGTAVTFTAEGQGSWGYQYRFWLNDGTGAKQVQWWSANPTWTMPATTPPGTYKVTVHVRTSLTVLKDATATVEHVVVRPPATGVTLTAQPPSPSPQGTPVTFTAEGQGSSGYQYRFWLNDGTGAKQVQWWSANPTWTMPGTTPPGTYRVTVHVRTNPTVLKDATTTLVHTITAGGVAAAP